jgi:anti-anti-sigma factor
MEAALTIARPLSELEAPSLVSTAPLARKMFGDSATNSKDPAVNEPLSLKVEQGDSVCTLFVAGEVDMAGVDELVTQLVAACERPTPVVVDLSGVTFMDSSGLRALVIAQNTATENGCELKISSPPPFVRSLLELTGADVALTIVD